jgi:small redox-active disulfide protein 2
MGKMNIKVLGPGCMNCKKLLETTRDAVQQTGAEAEIEYVTDMGEITKYVMMTPGLVINEKVMHQGKPLPNVQKVKDFILTAQER